MPPVIVVDTNVLLSTVLGGTGATRSIIRGCIDGTFESILGQALHTEYWDVLTRPQLIAQSRLSTVDQLALFDAFVTCCRWVDVYFRWRPNLPDEGDNHLMELAVAGQAEWLVTQNVRDFVGAELRFPGTRITQPEAFLKEYATWSR